LARVAEKMHRCFETGAVWEDSFPLRGKDGGYRWFLSRAVPVRDASGKVLRWLGTHTDVTAQRESELRFRGTFENAAVGIVHVDATGRFLRVNEKYCAIVGYPHDELIQKTVQDITHPEDVAASMPPLWAVLRGESPGFALEKRYLRKDGSVVWVE